MPLGWLLFQPDATYWLDPESSAFLSNTVGSLAGLGLGVLTKVACAYKVEPTNPLDLLGVPFLTGSDANSGCAHANGSALEHDLEFHIPYLPPGTYALRLFVGDLAYVDVPGLHAVAAGTVSLLDL